jgi:colanic acid/amylovoran biosynthesis glycosyltransferase
VSPAVLTATVLEKQPVLVSFVATFLKREMLHVYRQVTGIQRYENWIITRRLENERLFPASRVVSLHRHPMRVLQRVWCRVRQCRIPLDSSERRHLHRICRDRRAEVFHAYFGTEAARCLPFLRETSMAKVVSFHGVDLSEKMAPAELKAVQDWVDLFLCRSKSLASRLCERGVDPSLIRLNYTGVPVPVKAHRPSGGNPVRLLQACRFLKKKGLDTTLGAVAILRREGHDVRLTLAGDGPETSNLLDLTSSLGLRELVKFTGFLGNEELGRLYHEHDIFLHPSRTTAEGDREGIPNALLEAMAHSLPVISTRHSGIPEAVTHGETGWLIDHSDPEELARAIRALANSTEERGRIGAAARQFVIQRFSTDACVRSLESCYDEAREIADGRRKAALT